MNESEFLEELGADAKDTIGLGNSVRNAANLSASQVQPPDSLKIAGKRVFHTRTEFNIYSNGAIYPSKTQSWFEDKVYPLKKKATPIIIKKTEIKKIEDY